jgi:glycine hydroxymethyltransferase
LSSEFKAIQRQTLRNAAVLASELAGKGYGVVTGGTENHQVLVDVTSKSLDGQQGEQVLEQVGIVANRNVLPRDATTPGRVSGIRLGSGAAAARGMDTAEMVQVATLIDKAWRNPTHAKALAEVAAQVIELCHRFPVYGH